MITLLHLGGFPSCLSHPYSSSSSNKLFSPTSSIDTFTNNSTYSFLITLNYKYLLNYNNNKLIRASENPNNSAAETTFDHDGQLISRISACKDSNEALELIAEMTKTSSGVVSVQDCSSIISAALDCNNADLALSIFSAMRSTFDQQAVGDKGLSLERWKWSRPDVKTYALLVCGLAASLRVSDALRVIANVCRVRVSPSEEVPFGKIVRCPSCMIAVAVAQPQDGIQAVSCSKCRYQYELVSGDIISIESEEISMNVPAWKRGLKFLQLIKEGMPAAVHSVVVQTPSGMARTHKFATATVDLPAQEGQRVSIAVAAPSNSYRDVGPLKLSAKPPTFYPGEPMCLTNHRDGRESPLLRAPRKEGSISLINPSTLFPLLAVLGFGDAASGIIDPSLPKLISIAAVSSLVIGATLNNLVLPELSRIPQRTVDVIAIRQQLLAQYDVLQTRIKDLKEAAENEDSSDGTIFILHFVLQSSWLQSSGLSLYRCGCWLVCANWKTRYLLWEKLLTEKYIYPAIHLNTFRDSSARRTRVKRVREGLKSSLRSRIELIESYARISSMIEIEVEMDTDVLAAEAAGNAESIAQQIEQIMELENLEERWKQQVEANDEVERLLSSESIHAEQITKR